MVEVAEPTPRDKTIGAALEDRIDCHAALQTANSRIRATRDWSEGQ